MAGLLDIFDMYGRRARAYPALILISPAVVAAVATIPTTTNQSYFGSGLAAVVSAAGFYALTQVVRLAGRRIEPDLWKSWGGPPSTRLMLWSDSTLSDEWKLTAHATVKSAVSIRLLTREEEASDPDRARQLVKDAFMQVRSILDAEKPQGQYRVHNAEYGFARNLLGGCPYGMIVAVVSTICCAGFWLVRRTPWPGLGACVCVALLVGFAVAKWLWLRPLAKIAADWYAERAWTTFVEMKRHTKTESKEATE